jgi:DNA repair protein RecO
VSQERSEAVVLRGVDFSDTSRIVTFLTPERGRLSCIAKGARRAKSGLGPLLDTFNRVELVYYWKEGRSVQNLADVSLLDGYPTVKGDLARGAYAAFPLEVASRVAHENEPSQDLYAALVDGLEQLGTWPGDAKVHACWQALRLLSVAGFEPLLDAPDTGKGVGFSFEDGVRGDGSRGDRRLSRADSEKLCVLVRNRATCPEVEDVDALFDVVGQYAQYHLESDLKSLRVIRQLFRRTAT